MEDFQVRHPVLDQLPGYCVSLSTSCPLLLLQAFNGVSDLTILRQQLDSLHPRNEPFMGILPWPPSLPTAVEFPYA